RERHMLHLVVLRRRCSVSVDIVDLIDGHPRIRDGGTYGTNCWRAIRLRARTMKIIGLFATSAKDAKNLRAAAKCSLQRLQHQSSCAFGQNETAAILGKRLRGLFREIVLSGV